MSEEQVVQILRERLRIRVETKSVYTGGLFGDGAYVDVLTVKLLFDGEVISEDEP